MSDSLALKRVSGADLGQYIPDLARLRLEVFREFPYLYDGDLAYEERYLATYVRCPRAVIVVALDGTRVVGASTGLPLAEETPEFQRPFHAAGYEAAKIFYCAESVVVRSYRGRGLGPRFFTEREAHAQALGGFDWFTFCAVERPPDHPRRPDRYRPLNAFWERQGYVCQPALWTTFAWKDLDEAAATPKRMVYWLKPAR